MPGPPSPPSSVHETIELFMRAPRKTIARRLLDLAEDASWWPGARTRGTYGWVELIVPAGPLAAPVRLGAEISPVREWDGFSWRVTRGELLGTAEWYLESVPGGTVVHHFFAGARAPDDGWRTTAMRARRHRAAIARGMFALKDALGAGPVQVP